MDQKIKRCDPQTEGSPRLSGHWGHSLRNDGNESHWRDGIESEPDLEMAIISRSAFSMMFIDLLSSDLSGTSDSCTLFYTANRISGSFQRLQRCINPLCRGLTGQRGV